MIPVCKIDGVKNLNRGGGGGGGMNKYTGA